MPTLDYFKTHPLRIAKPQTHLTITQVRASEHTTIHPQDMHPSAGAFIHYGGVELADMLTITKPTLGDEELAQLTGLWYNSCGKVAKQLLFYTWLICVKEMRHGSSGKCDKAFSGWSRSTDPGMQDAIGLCKTVSSGGNYTKHLDSNGSVNVSQFIAAVEQQFRHGGWGGAFGGVKWADIALEIRRYFEGESSAMIAADRCWTLVHNTGPIFNKGFYFTHHDNNLLKILNAQATTSVFSLGLNFLDTDSDYSHTTSSNFNLFAKLAIAAIQSVKPDYTAGSTGGVTSDGGKGLSLAQGNANTTVTDKNGNVTKVVGPFSITTNSNREDA